MKNVLVWNPYPQKLQALQFPLYSVNSCHYLNYLIWPTRLERESWIPRVWKRCDPILSPVTADSRSSEQLCSSSDWWVGGVRWLHCCAPRISGILVKWRRPQFTFSPLSSQLPSLHSSALTPAHSPGRPYDPAVWLFLQWTEPHRFLWVSTNVSYFPIVFQRCSLYPSQSHVVGDFSLFPEWAAIIRRSPSSSHTELRILFVCGAPWDNTTAAFVVIFHALITTGEEAKVRRALDRLCYGRGGALPRTALPRRSSNFPLILVGCATLSRCSLRPTVSGRTEGRPVPKGAAGRSYTEEVQPHTDLGWTPLPRRTALPWEKQSAQCLPVMQPGHSCSSLGAARVCMPLLLHRDSRDLRLPPSALRRVISSCCTSLLVISVVYAELLQGGMKP